MKCIKILSLIFLFSLSDILVAQSIAVQPDNIMAHRLYTGLTVGYGTTTWNGLLAPNDEAFIMAISTPTSVNEGGTIGGIFIGYELLPSFAVEFSYTHYANAKLYFDEYSLITYNYGVSHLTSLTNNYSLVGKFIVPVPYTHNIRIFSSVGPAVTHRQDTVYNHWQLVPSFNLGFDIDVTEHIMAEVGGNYTAGTAISEMDPVKDYIPFLYSAFARLAWRF